MVFLGIDLGSSSIKFSLFDAAQGVSLGSLSHPGEEMPISSPEAGFAEQDPHMWWDYFKQGLANVLQRSDVDGSAIKGIGISYQMHGLVCLDEQLQPVYPSIIWCDSRAVAIGNSAFAELGEDYCYTHLLNSPGNFTAAKLRWVQQHAPEVYAKIRHIMLPGDYIATCLSGEPTTTAGNLSEGTLWDFQRNDIARELLHHWQIDESFIPAIKPSIGQQCAVSAAMASELGLSAGTPITYRCGDQPNNAFSLNVSQPGEVALSAGTSAVLYALTQENIADRENVGNTFKHVTSTDDRGVNGLLVCINGGARAYNWLKHLLGEDVSYRQLSDMAASVPAGSRGLTLLPFGNGAERMFANRTLGAHLLGLDFNQHGRADIARAFLEGVAFILGYGFQRMQSIGYQNSVVRAAHSGLFLSDTFTQTLADVIGRPIERIDSDGAEGAARGAAVGSSYFATVEHAFASQRTFDTVMPNSSQQVATQEAFDRWQLALQQTLQTQE